jgi:hypothetical protein
VIFVAQITSGRSNKVWHLSECGATRLARDLLMTASPFGLMEGGTNRSFTRRSDLQWFRSPQSGFLQGTIWVYAEDGVTPLAKGSVNVSGGKTYQLVLGGG